MDNNKHYPGSGSAGSIIYAEVCRYELREIRCKGANAQENAVAKLTGDANANDASILQALWDALQKKACVAVYTRYDRLVAQGKWVPDTYKEDVSPFNRQ